MTDREMAIALSEYIIRWRRRSAILRAIISERGIAIADPPQWEDLAQLTPQYDDIQRQFSSQLVELQQTLPDQISASEAILRLHNYFLEQSVRHPLHLP